MMTVNDSYPLPELPFPYTKNEAYESKKEHLQILQATILDNSTPSNQHDHTNDLTTSSAPPSYEDSTYSPLLHVAATCDGGKRESEPLYDNPSFKEKEVKSDVSWNAAPLSETYGERNASGVFVDPEYAVSFQN